MSPGAKASAESATEMVQLVLPNDANPLGAALGGTVMHWMDLAAAITAHRHARRPVVTVSVDSITFEAPIRVGQVAIVNARLTFVGRTSMEIRVDVDCEDLDRGARHRTSTAYFTFVALDEKGRPYPVPDLAPASEAERQEMEEARSRRARRLEGRESSPRA